MPTSEQIEAAREWLDGDAPVEVMWSEDVARNARNQEQAIASLAALLEAREAAARAEEREACARMADGYATQEPTHISESYDSGWYRSAMLVARAIRARGETP